MHFPQVKWLVFLGAIVNAAGPVEVDLVFPRNATYSPAADRFPVVFAVQNPQRAELLNIRINSYVRKDDDINSEIWSVDDLSWANWSSGGDPYLVYHYLQGVNTTGSWSVDWDIHWDSCDVETLAKQEQNGYNSPPGGVYDNYYAWRRYFTIGDSAPKDVDLVAATANATCPSDPNAIVINVTDTIMHSPTEANAAHRDTCVVTKNSTTGGTHTTQDPCRVAIDSDTVASMAAVQQKRLCDVPHPPDNCPVEENAARQWAVVGVSTLLAAVGAVGVALL